ncbi:MAG: hypothetical protein WCI05_00255 [Myxococcales bacterium]|jgi:hypothetical protein
MGTFARKLQKKLSKSQNLGSLIGELRKLMVEARNFNEIYDFFDEKLVSDDTFVQAGSPASNERLLAVVLGAIKVTLSEVRPADARFMHVAAHGLWHGFLRFPSGVMGVVIYFEDINRGLCSLADLSGLARYLRFSVPEGEGVPNPESAQLLHMSRRSNGPPDKPQ